MRLASEAQTRAMRLTALHYGAAGINLYELRPMDGQPVAFTAGAHVDVHIGNGLVRQYSLANDPCEHDRYLLGVKRDLASRGGSKFLHDLLRPGDVLQIGSPKNHFALAEEASHTVFVAGGIGITPIRSMIHRAEAIGLSWELHYAVRTSDDVVFLRDFESDSRVKLHVDSLAADKPLDLESLAQRSSPAAHVYCCGPAPMIQTFESAFRRWPDLQRHVEHFGASDAGLRTGSGFDVVLARSGQTVRVGPDQSILEAVRAAGIQVAASCEQGVCGACEVRVLAGEPDHRDTLLSPDERAAGDCMMICCSRSKSNELVLDL